MSELPRAPTFPAFVDDLKETKDTKELHQADTAPSIKYSTPSVKALQERFVAEDCPVPSPSQPVTTASTATTTTPISAKSSATTSATSVESTFTTPNNIKELYPPVTATPASATLAKGFAMEESSTTSSSVPVVPLPVAQSKGRIRNILLWRDPKVSGLVFSCIMLFFYLTLFKRLSIVSVLGGVMTVYLIVGLILVNVNNMTGHQLDKYIKRPAVQSPIFKKEVVNRWAETLIEEGNEIGEVVRDVLYCDNTKRTLWWILASLVVYIVGKYFSLLPIFFVLALLAFSVPLAYERNKKDVDAAVAKAADTASKHLESGRKIAGQKASQIREMAAEKLEKAPPAARSLGAKFGLTPAKKKM